MNIVRIELDSDYSNDLFIVRPSVDVTHLCSIDDKPDVGYCSNSNYHLLSGYKTRVQTIDTWYRCGVFYRIPRSW